MLEDEEFRAFLKALGARIREVRKGKNLDMRHIMITSGYYDAQWRKYETGGSLNVQSLLKIALTLDVPLSELFDGLGQWPKLSVEEIQKQRRPNPDSPEPEAKPTPEHQAKQTPSKEPATRIKSPQRGAKLSSEVVHLTAGAELQASAATGSRSSRKSAK